MEDVRRKREGGVVSDQHLVVINPKLKMEKC